jgi:hypothetical protein
MGSGRFIPPFFIVYLLLTLGPVAMADAGWGFGEGKGWGGSGLDLDHGYDVNTVTSVTGRVEAVTERDERRSLLEVRLAGENLFLVLGPKWYWAEKGIAVRPNDQITVRGSKAQGKDGSTYILVQRIINKSTGAEIVLRSESGRPVWSGGGRRGGANSPGR